MGTLLKCSAARQADGGSLVCRCGMVATNSRDVAERCSSEADECLCQRHHNFIQRAAAQAYDAALVRMRGTAAATNFALAGYRMELADFLNVQQVILTAKNLPWVACIACWYIAPWTKFLVLVCLSSVLCCHSNNTRQQFCGTQVLYVMPTAGSGANRTPEQAEDMTYKALASPVVLSFWSAAFTVLNRSNVETGP